MTETDTKDTAQKLAAERDDLQREISRLNQRLDLVVNAINALNALDGKPPATTVSLPGSTASRPASTGAIGSSPSP